MLRSELEKRIRHLEQGLDQFSGLDWIVKVGEIAEIKGAVLDMTAETEAYCSLSINTSNLQNLDIEIRGAVGRENGGRENGSQKTVDRRHAFQTAYGTLRAWLTPALPGERRGAKRG